MPEQKERLFIREFKSMGTPYPILYVIQGEEVSYWAERQDLNGGFWTKSNVTVKELQKNEEFIEIPF